MTGMQLLRDLSTGQLTGDQVGSQYVTLIPGMLQSGTFLADTGTAGLVNTTCSAISIFKGTVLVSLAQYDLKVIHTGCYYITIYKLYFRAVSLLLQVALPCLMFTPGSSHVTLRGGTNAEMAPQIDYTTNVLKPVLELFGVRMDCQILTR